MTEPAPTADPIEEAPSAPSETRGSTPPAAVEPEETKPAPRGGSKLPWLLVLLLAGGAVFLGVRAARVEAQMGAVRAELGATRADLAAAEARIDGARERLGSLRTQLASELGALDALLAGEAVASPEPAADVALP